MKSMKSLVLVGCLLTAFFVSANANAATLKDQTILYPVGSYLAGKPIPLGVDPYGYNYQAHMFSGSYFNAYANSAGFPPYNGDDLTYVAANPKVTSHWAWPYRADQVSMKWNDAWLSNTDSDGDGLLDRPANYQGSGAWENNHQSGSYMLGDQEINWNYFVKIVAVPSDATVSGTNWVDSSGKVIGPVIWGSFATIQEVYNDPGQDAHGISYHSPAGPGFGKY